MKYKDLWLSSLNKYKEHSNKDTHILRINNTYDAFGVLCDIHSRETGIKWESNSHTKVKSYMSNVCILPVEVLEWCEMNNVLYKKLVMLHSFDKIKEYLC